MSRAALLFVGATVAASAASCGGATESGPGMGDSGREASTDTGGGGDDTDAEPVALYGPAPIYDGGPQLDGARDAAKEAESGVDATAVMYGPATIDSGNGGG
jgi:hypothetical protein